MIYDATLNFQFVANNRSLLLNSTFNFLPFEKLIIDCNIKFSICLVPIMAWGFQNSIFCHSKNCLLNATFNFSIVFEDLIIDDNIQFSIFWCKIMGCQLQHSFLYSYDVYIRSFTFEFRRFVLDIRITGVNIQYAEVRAVGWMKSARTGTIPNFHLSAPGKFCLAVLSNGCLLLPLNMALLENRLSAFLEAAVHHSPTT